MSRAGDGGPATAPGLTVRNARLTLDGVRVLDGLDLRLEPGSWTCLLGPSGVGKTSLLRLVAGLIGPPEAEGAVLADDGRPVAGRLAWMAQTDALLPWLSARENVRLGARLRREPAAAGRERADALLARVGLADRADALPRALSGGMRQRVALARTLMEDRPFVLLDEPFSALDAVTRHALQAEAARLLAGRTVLLVTHDPMEALRLGHRILVLTGAPARLAEPLVPDGPPPRAPDDPSVVTRHGALLDRLAGVGEATETAEAGA
ncbi:MAG: ABC transporter ATP-binding protein [Azospirillaceae bacterium]